MHAQWSTLTLPTCGLLSSADDIAGVGDSLKGRGLGARVAVAAVHGVDIEVAGKLRGDAARAAGGGR